MQGMTKDNWFSNAVHWKKPGTSLKTELRSVKNLERHEIPYLCSKITANSEVAFNIRRIQSKKCFYSILQNTNEY